MAKDRAHIHTVGRSRATLLQIPRSAARILQYPITGDVDGEVGTQLPHRPGRHRRVQDENEPVVIWATLNQK